MFLKGWGVYSSLPEVSENLTSKTNAFKRNVNYCSSLTGQLTEAGKSDILIEGINCQKEIYNP